MADRVLQSLPKQAHFLLHAAVLGILKVTGSVQNDLGANVFDNVTFQVADPGPKNLGKTSLIGCRRNIQRSKSLPSVHRKRKCPIRAPRNRLPIVHPFCSPAFKTLLKSAARLPLERWTPAPSTATLGEALLHFRVIDCFMEEKWTFYQR